MGPTLGPARALPGPAHSYRDRARNFEKGSSSTQARDRFFEKGLENWDFYVVKKEARQGSGSNFCEGPGLGLGSRSIFKARDRPGIDFLGLDPSLMLTTPFLLSFRQTNDIKLILNLVDIKDDACVSHNF